MHRPTPRSDALRERVLAGRLRRDAKRRRTAAARKGGRRLVALFAGLGMIASVLTVTQLASSAVEDQTAGLGSADCVQPTAIIEDVANDEDLELHIEEDAEGHVHYHYRPKSDSRSKPGRGKSRPTEAPATAAPTVAPTEAPDDGGCDDEGSGADAGERQGNVNQGNRNQGNVNQGNAGNQGSGNQGSGNQGGGGRNQGGRDGSGADRNNGLDVLGRTCDSSNLPLHTGFIEPGPRCVDTQFGEIPEAALAPSLLITDFPSQVGADQSFTITISSRNLLRDRFLGAAAGGYLLESSFLNEEGVVRGHVHVGCLNLAEGNLAPDLTPAPAHFVAVEDLGGGAVVDFFQVEIPPLTEPGTYRCMAWAGDGSHRVPMAERANQQVAVDAVRITVT